MVLRPYMFTMDTKFTYNLPMTEIDDEICARMKLWCIQNNIQVRKMCFEPECYMFFFASEEDQVAFKLRWT